MIVAANWFRLRVVVLVFVVVAVVIAAAALGADPALLVNLIF